MEKLGSVRSWHTLDSTLFLETDQAQVLITLLALDLVRVQMVPKGTAPQNRSYAVITSPDYWQPVNVHLHEAEHVMKWQAGSAGITVEIEKDPLRLTIKRADHSHATACTPGEGLAVMRRGIEATGSAWSLQAPSDLHYYGFGQKQGFLNKRGERLSQWATDEPLHILEHDELYQAIPFFLTLDQEGRSAGIFIDCPSRVTHDVAKARPDVCQIETALPVLDAYIFAGPDPKNVIERYTELTGRIELPPLWALGYQQCRYSYYPEERVREIAAQMRAREIPCDVIYLDIHYMDGFRVFTWDRERFPNPRQMVADLAADGFKTVTIVDPGVKVDGRYEVFQAGIRDGHFVCHPDGELFIGTVWPGRTAFPDFLRAETRSWWGELHRELVCQVGIAGIWNDMNEPSCFARNTFPPEVLQGEEGEQQLHAEVHNVYGQTMAMATHAGLKRLQPDKRPFLLTRSGYAGIQRYAAVWMGDNHSWWEHLRLAIPMCLGMGLCGVPFVGTDIGGFQHDAKGELFARWLQMGALMPFCRNHAAYQTADQEPWSFGPEIEDIARRFLRLRYRLLPFLYNEFYKASTTGLPIMRPLFLQYPQDPATFEISDQFLLGEDLLVCPVYQPGASKRLVYLPPGEWVDFWTGERLNGKQHIIAEAPLERMPLFVRSGAIIPMELPINHTGERDGKKLFLHVYLPTENSGCLELYEDRGEGFGYQTGEWAKTTVTAQPAGNGFMVQVGNPRGEFAPPREEVIVHLHLGKNARDLLRRWQVNVAGASAAVGPLGELVVTVPTPNAAGFVLQIE